MKAYIGEWALGGVTVTVADGGRRRPLRRLVADDPGGPVTRSTAIVVLASSILGDYLVRAPDSELDQAFRRDFVEELDLGAAWTITAAEIAAWLALDPLGDRGQLGSGQW